MKALTRYILIALALLAFSIFNLPFSPAHAQGTAFTYQGRLNNGSGPANGYYDLQFILFTTNQFGFPAVPILTNSPVPVNNGLFTTTLNFGSGVFTGTNYWLDISVRTNGNGAFTGLTPRQPITPAPYAIIAETAETVNNLPGLTVQQNAAGAPNVILGSSVNFVASGVIGATVAGGVFNVASGDFSVAGGGTNNLAGGYGSVVGGGSGNHATNNFATVPGGKNNLATGQCSFAAGQNAHATNDNSFVWCDGNPIPITSIANASVTFNASGGYRFFTGSGAGAQLPANGTSWTTISDRNAKKNFQVVDTLAVLEKLAMIPMQQWNYKWEKDTDVPNIGPMAQDFKHAFYPGRDDKGISTLEFDGVELAAIQGLNRKLEEQNSQLNKKDVEIQELKQRLEILEKIVLNQKSN